jgi:hypothetical protein
VLLAASTRSNKSSDLRILFPLASANTIPTTASQGETMRATSGEFKVQADCVKTRSRPRSAQYRCVPELCRESILRRADRKRIKVVQRRRDGEFAHSLRELCTEARALKRLGFFGA